MSRYWNQSRNSFRTPEPVSHIKSRYRIGKILEENEFKIDYGYKETGYKLPIIYPELDYKKTYTVDIYAEKDDGTRKYIEIDGKIHFSSRYKKGKTDTKHIQIKECLNIDVIHFIPEEIVGKYKLTDLEIWDRIR
jgi:hypothetical protein